MAPRQLASGQTIRIVIRCLVANRGECEHFLRSCSDNKVERRFEEKSSRSSRGSVMDDDLQKIMSCTCLRMRRATRRVTQRYDHALEPTGLTASQVRVAGLSPWRKLCPRARVVDRSNC